MARRESQAVAFINAGRIDLAERLLRDQLKETPRNSEAHRLLAHCLRRRGELVDSLTEANEALRLSPDSWLCHLERGRTLHALMRPTDAEAEMREALRMAPRSPFVHAMLAEFLLDRGSFDEAIATARAGLQINPRDPTCLSILAVAQLRSNRVEAAHDTVQEALASDPTQANLHNTLGSTLHRMGATDAAAAEFREALRLDPQLRLAESNLDATRRNLARPFRSPYGQRFRSAWTCRRRPWRIAALASLAVLGFVWPGFWGAGTYPLALEISRPFIKRSSSLASGVTLAAWVGPLIILLPLLLGTAHTDVVPLPTPTCVAREVPSDLPFLWPSDMPQLVDWPCAQYQYTETETSYDPDHEAAVARLLTGAALIWVVMPALVTRGRAKRAAQALAVTALLVALWGAWPGANPIDSGMASALIVAGAPFAGGLVFRIESAGW
jgi:Flp pilus assembly protein TadD